MAACSENPEATKKWCSYFVLPEGLGSLFKPTHNKQLKSSGDLQKAAGPRGDWLRYTSIIFDPEPPGPCKIRCAFSRYISWSWTEKMAAKNTGGFQCFYASHAVTVGLYIYIFLIPISWSKRTKTKQRTPPKFQWLFRGLHKVTSFSLAVLFLHFRPWFSTYSCTFTERSARRWRSEGFGTWRAMPSQTPK